MLPSSLYTHEFKSLLADNETYMRAVQRAGISIYSLGYEDMPLCVEAPLTYTNEHARAHTHAHTPTGRRTLRAIVPKAEQAELMRSIDKALHRAGVFRSNSSSAKLSHTPQKTRSPKNSRHRRPQSALSHRKGKITDEDNREFNRDGKPATLTVGAALLKDQTHWDPKPTIPIQLNCARPVQRMLTQQEEKEREKERIAKEKARWKRLGENFPMIGQDGERYVYDKHGRRVSEEEYERRKEEEEKQRQREKERAREREREEQERARETSESKGVFRGIICEKTSKYVEAVREKIIQERQDKRWSPHKLPSSTVPLSPHSARLTLAGTDSLLPLNLVVQHPEYDALEEGDVMVTVEHCAHCDCHEFDTRHDEEQYAEIARAVVAALKRCCEGFAVRFLSVLKPLPREDAVRESVLAHKHGRALSLSRSESVLPSTLSAAGRRVGACEVQVAVFSQRSRSHTPAVHILHSKLSCGAWPSLSLCTARLEALLTELGVPQRSHTVRPQTQSPTHAQSLTHTLSYRERDSPDSLPYTPKRRERANTTAHLGTKALLRMFREKQAKEEDSDVLHNTEQGKITEAFDFRAFVAETPSEVHRDRGREKERERQQEKEREREEKKEKENQKRKEKDRAKERERAKEHPAGAETVKTITETEKKKEKATTNHGKEKDENEKEKEKERDSSPSELRAHTHAEPHTQSHSHSDSEPAPVHTTRPHSAEEMAMLVSGAALERESIADSDRGTGIVAVTASQRETETHRDKEEQRETSSLTHMLAEAVSEPLPLTHTEAHSHTVPLAHTEPAPPSDTEPRGLKESERDSLTSNILREHALARTDIEREAESVVIAQLAVENAHSHTDTYTDIGTHTHTGTEAEGETDTNSPTHTTTHKEDASESHAHNAHTTEQPHTLSHSQKASPRPTADTHIGTHTDHAAMPQTLTEALPHIEPIPTDDYEDPDLDFEDIEADFAGKETPKETEKEMPTETPTEREFPRLLSLSLTHTDSQTPPHTADIDREPHIFTDTHTETTEAAAEPSTQTHNTHRVASAREQILSLQTLLDESSDVLVLSPLPHRHKHAQNIGDSGKGSPNKRANGGAALSENSASEEMWRGVAADLGIEEQNSYEYEDEFENEDGDGPATEE